MRLEIKYKKKKTNLQNHKHREETQCANKKPLVTEQIKCKILEYLETTENENRAMQSLWNATKAVLRGKFREMYAYLKKLNKNTSNKQLYI